MRNVLESLLIASAPTEMLVGLGIMFAVVALTLLALAMEAGSYPEVCAWRKAVQPPGILMRRHRRRALLYAADTMSVEALRRVAVPMDVERARATLSHQHSACFAPA